MVMPAITFSLSHFSSSALLFLSLEVSLSANSVCNDVSRVELAHMTLIHTFGRNLPLVSNHTSIRYDGRRQKGIR